MLGHLSKECTARRGALHSTLPANVNSGKINVCNNSPAEVSSIDPGSDHSYLPFIDNLQCLAEMLTYRSLS